MFDKLIPYDTAYDILDAYMGYYHQFKRITKRAKIRFENRDWSGLQDDMKERRALYRYTIGNTTDSVRESLEGKQLRADFWINVKQMYFDEIRNFNTRNIAETFYNSVFRHLNQGLSANPETMFVHSTGTYREFKSIYPIYHNFDFTQSIEDTLERMFSLYDFDAPLEDLERDIIYLARTLQDKINSLHIHWKYLRVQVLKSIFYRNKCAYLVGRLYVYDSILPFVIPLLNGEDGIYIDTLLLDQNEASPIFSYHRSYFMVDIDIVSETVDFIRSILPTKQMGEVYSSIGFEKHGKTVFFRDFQRHLICSDDKFIIAPGIKGMVMSVFTLPSFNMVFKIIKDRFAPPKNMTEAEVKEKYALVNQHDRVGRMTDAHVFENLVFDRNRFTKELLEELQEFAPSKVELTDEYVKIRYVYVEKKMIPLNLYLQNEHTSVEQAYAAINEYGKAIKELASVNIFPGDLLLKNFGVTRLKRVVFYDYDEIGFLTDYNFREIPEARDDFDEFSSEPYFHVGPNDIFPEEFMRFLIGDRKLKSIFLELHGDLFAIKFWRGMQKKIKNRELIDIYPYSEQLRFKNLYAEEIAV